MTDNLQTALVNRYGLPALLGGVLGVLLIWILAHNMSEPGSEVSIVWGLVSYTKASEPHRTPMAVKLEEIGTPQIDEVQADKTTEVSLPTLTLDQIHFETEPTTSVLSLNRENYGLRQLMPLESGRPIRETPNGTYFFSLLVWFDSEDSSASIEFQRHEVQRFSTRRKLEIHRANDGQLFMIGFLSDSDAAQISKLDGSKKSVVLKAQWHEEFKVKARIPIDRIYSSSGRQLNMTERKNVNVLDLVVH